jgi:PAS domain S-box-containing protein
MSTHQPQLAHESKLVIDSLSRIQAFVREMLVSTSLDAALCAVCEAARDVTAADVAAIYLQISEDEPMLRLAYSLGFSEEARANYAIWPREAVEFSDGGPFIWDGRAPLNAFRLHLVRANGHQTSMEMPLSRDGYVYGVLLVGHRDEYAYSERDIQTVEIITSQASLAVENAILGQASTGVQHARLLREYQQQYERLIESNQRISAILDSSSDGIILLDQNGNLMQFNRSAEELLSINLDDYINENLSTMLLDRVRTEEDSPETRDALQKMARILRLEPERITRHEYELKRRGQASYIEEVGSPMFDSQHRVIGRLLVLRDVSERKLLETYRDEITNMAIHDLRGPVGSIISSLALAIEIINDPLDMPLEESLIPSLEVSLDSANYLLRLVDSLLDIAKLETRQLPINFTPWPIAELVESAERALARSFQEAGVRLQKQIPADLPLSYVDEDKIRRVIINLLDNALRFSPEAGTVLVEAMLTDNGRRILVRVADRGKGVPVEERERIFEKFRQIRENAPERGRKGSGLGLTFCRLAVEAHGGQIWVEDHGALPGAIFAFTVPVAFENRNIT